MKSENIYDGMTDIRDDLIDGAQKAPSHKKRRLKPVWFGAAAAVLAVVVTCVILLRPGAGETVHAAALASYPEMNPYPGDDSYTDEEYDAWWNDVLAQRRDLGDTSSLRTFFTESTRTFLQDTEGKNRVYSPLNLYMALSMLAQITDGNSRAQILTLLGSDSMEALRKQVNDVWNANYRDDEILTSVLANSVWLNQNLKFQQDTMDTLAKDFYASSYQGEMGSDEFNKTLQDWLSEQTGGLLKEQAGNIALDPQTVLALASTIYFKANWQDKFSQNDTRPQTFHAPDGDRETDFMYQEDGQTYYWGDKFSAVSQSFYQGGYMWFLLPDEGVAPEDLLTDEETMNFLFTDRSEWEHQKGVLVRKSIPKFDVSSQADLSEGLQSLGVTDVFDSSVSDFSPMLASDAMPVEVSDVNHAARVVIDEEGCTAAAFTAITTEAMMMDPPDEVDFVLDRPFLFCITGANELPLFVGIVNTPVE